jgi:hypothetical protein
MATTARTAGHVLHDPQCSRKTVPISSQITNAYIDFSKMTCSVVTVIAQVMRDGRPWSATLQFKRPLRPGRAPARAFPLINQLKTGGTIVRQDGLRLVGFLQSQGSYPLDDLRAIAYFR